MRKLIFLFAAVSFFTATFGQQNAKKPNIIVVLADDIGVGDISKYRRVHSNNIVLETPNIDRLADEGFMFTDAHSSSALCATSRYGVMTGNSNYRSTLPWGLWSGYAKSVIKEDQLTLGELMKKANYNTAFLGKWHLGTSFAKKGVPNKIYEPYKGNKPILDIDITKIIHGPKDLGFDYSLTLPAGIQDVPYAIYENHEWLKLKENSEITLIDQSFLSKIGLKLDKTAGLGDSNWDPHNIGPLLIEKATDYIAANANKEKPFFMYYCSQAVHVPHAPSVKLGNQKIQGTTPSLHLDMVKELDVQMGMLVAELKKQGIYENTVFIFTSDNGGLGGPKETRDAGHKVSDIYRGAKNQAYEGGHRVPFIVTWPEVIKKKQTSKTPILGQDILATIAAISNQELTENVAQDSYNLLPILTKNNKENKRIRLMVQGGSGHEVMIIEDGWKLIISVDKKDQSNATRTPIALFDLNTNVEENEKFNFIASKKHQEKLKYLFDTYNKTRDSGVTTAVH